MEVPINSNGQAVAVEVTLEVYEFLDRADHKTENLFHEQRPLEVYEFLDRADHKTENLFHEQRRHWDGREFDEYIITTEGVGITKRRTCSMNSGGIGMAGSLTSTSLPPRV